MPPVEAAVQLKKSLFLNANAEATGSATEEIAAPAAHRRPEGSLWRSCKMFLFAYSNDAPRPDPHSVVR